MPSSHPMGLEGPRGGCSARQQRPGESLDCPPGQSDSVPLADARCGSCCYTGMIKKPVYCKKRGVQRNGFFGKGWEAGHKAHMVQAILLRRSAGGHPGLHSLGRGCGMAQPSPGDGVT